MRLLADYHTHTRYSHGKGTIEDNVKAAIDRGLETIGIADHGPANLFGVGIAGERRFVEMRNEVDRISYEHPEIRILLGVEANIVSESGQIDISPEAQRFLDFVLAGCHTNVRTPGLVDFVRLNFGHGLARLSPRLGRAFTDMTTRSVVNSVSMNRIMAITHPGFRLDIDTRAVASASARAGTLLEINASHPRLDVDYVRIAAAQGARFIVSSDAHSPLAVGVVDRALQLIEESGVDVGLVTNVEP